MGANSNSKVVSGVKVAPMTMVAQPKTTGKLEGRHSNRAAAPTNSSTSVLSRSNPDKKAGK